MKSLWIAVLAQAVKDLKDKNELNRKKAEIWIKSDNEEDQSFNWICRMVKLDPGMTKERIFANTDKIVQELNYMN